MNELHERVNQIKLKVLDVIESRINENTSIQDLQNITFALNNIDEDKNYLAKTFGLLGFNGNANSTKTESAE